MDKAPTLLFFLLISIASNAQITFQKTFGDSILNDVGQSILQTSDGGYLIAGTQYTSGNLIGSIFLIRTNSAGDTLWTKLIKEPTVNYSAAQVIQTSDGGFAIIGIKGGGITFVPYLLKLDAAGNILWNRTYLWFADEHINSIVQTPDSGYLLAGYLYNGNNLVYFIRTNASGDTLWTKSYGESSYNASVYSVRMAKDGGFVAAGSIQNTATQDVDAFLFKTDATGIVQWARGYGDVGYDYAQQVEATSDSGFVIAAVTYSFGAGLADFFLIKTDSTGGLLWAKTFGGTSDDRSESVRQTADGGYLFTGESSSFSFGNFDIYMVRTDAMGDTIWTRTLNGLENNEGYSMALTSDSGFAMTGSYFNHFTNNDVFFVKADAHGAMGCFDRSSATVVLSPSTTVTNHHLNFFPSEPSVLPHILESSSGTFLETLCFSDGVDEPAEEIDFNIYPNPVQDKINLVWNQCRISNIGILDLPGRNVASFDAIPFSEGNPLTTQIEVSQLPPGIYFLRAQSEKKLIVRKFIKQ